MLLYFIAWSSISFKSNFDKGALTPNNTTANKA